MASEKVVLVTGGASGIGLSYVRELIKNGCKGCAVVDIAGEDAVKEFGDRVLFIKADVTDGAAFEDAFKTTISQFGSINIVINNAGVFNEEDWEKCIAINATSVSRGTLLAMKYMGTDEGGHGGVVINVGSIMGLRVLSGGPIYTASKHFVVSYTRCMGTPFYFDKTGVKVMAICPGFTDTPICIKMRGMARFEGQAQLAMNQFLSLPVQEASAVGNILLKVLEIGKNGSAWVIEGNELQEAVLTGPNYQQ